MKDIKKIDIHAHATPFPDIYPAIRFGNGMISAPELLEMYEKINVEKAVLLPLVFPEGQCATIPSEDCKYLADMYPENFLWFCNVDPRALHNNSTCDLTPILNEYKKMGAKGVGEVAAQIYTDDPKMENLFACCAACDLPVTIHISPDFANDNGYGMVDEIGLPRLEKMLKKYPNLKILGHSQPFWAEMSGDLTPETRNDYPTGKVTDGRIAQLMRECPNLYCDLSAGSGSNALMRDEEYAAKFVEEFADRLLYGCDITAAWNTHGIVFDQWLDKMVEQGAISLENYKKIVRENAIKLLGL